MYTYNTSLRELTYKFIDICITYLYILDLLARVEKYIYVYMYNICIYTIPARAS